MATVRVGDTLPDVLEKARILGQTEGVKRATGKGRRRHSGRPTRLHQGLIDQVVELIRQGNYQETAALACGIPSSTYHSWKARGQEARALIDAMGRLPEGKEGERLFLGFLEATEAARAEAESNAVVALQRLAFGGEVSEVEVHYDPETEEKIGETIRFTKPDGTSLRWYLERSAPTRFGKRLEVSGPDAGPIPVEVEVSARDLVRKRLASMADKITTPDESLPEDADPA